MTVVDKIPTMANMSKKKHSLLIFHSLQDEDMHILVKGAFAVDPPTDNVRQGLGSLAFFGNQF